MKLWVLAAAGGLCVMAVPCAAGAAAAVNTQQFAYDQAQAAMDRENWAAAAAGFAPLLPTDPGKRLSRSQAIIAARLGEALMHLQRNDEARDWLARAITNLPADDPTQTVTWLIASDTARFSYDFSAAVTAYRHAIALATRTKDGATLLSAQLGLAQANLTIDPAASAQLLDAVLAGPGIATLDKPAVAQIEDLRARAAIIAGDRAGARRWIDRALEHSGGLAFTHVSVRQAEIRGDAAIIARLSNDNENARKYLTYTGAGHLKNMDWIGRYSGELPICGAGDVAPQDSVVVQFMLTDDGRVEAAIPVYVSRPGEAGAVFAQAVSGWRWNPADLTGVDGFLRSTLRLELRCQSRPMPAQLAKPYLIETAEWFAAVHKIDEATLASIRTDAEGVQPVASDDALVPLLLGRPSWKHPDAMSYDQAEQALTAVNAPASVHAVLAYRAAKMKSNGARGVASAEGITAAALASTVPPLMKRFPEAAASYWLQLEWALALESAGRFDSARPLVGNVAAASLSVLPADDPVRRVAQLHSALIDAHLGNGAAARATLAASGLNAQQCALFDTRPIPTSVAIASSQFPQDALRWSFEGNVKEAFDIASDGSVTNVRTVVAYPPFVFGPSTEKAVARFRYVPPSIDGHAVGCQSQMQTVNYRVPG